MTMTSVLAGMLRVAAGELPDNILNPAVTERPMFRAKLARHAAHDKR